MPNPRNGLPAGDATPRLLVFGVMPETGGSTAEGLAIARRVGTVHVPFLHRSLVEPDGFQGVGISPRVNDSAILTLSSACASFAHFIRQDSLKAVSLMP